MGVASTRTNCTRKVRTGKTVVLTTVPAKMLRQVSTNVLTDAQHTTTFPKDAHSRNSQASAAPLQFVVTAKQTSTSPRVVYTRTNCTNKARSGMMDVPTSVSVLMAPQ